MPSKIDDYDIIGKIGSGSYGTCKKIRRIADGKMLVWKELNYGEMTEHEKEMLVCEVNLLRELKHANIVRYYDRVIDRKNAVIYIVMEFCEGGDLAAFISKQKIERRYVNEDFVWKVFRQLCLALQECHKRRKGGAVMHRDLKPANVFLTKENDVKLGDFGLARVLRHNTSFAKTFVGTPYYMSPEQISEEAYNEKSDIWSLGCLLYELCALIPPFNAANQKSLAVKIRDGRFRPLPECYSDELARCIGSMLRVQRDKRPGIGDLLKSSALTRHQMDKEKASLKRREEDLDRREAALDEREKELNKREKALIEKERTAKPSQKFTVYESPHELEVVERPKNGKKGAKMLELQENELAQKKRVTFSDQFERKPLASENQIPLFRKGLRF